MKKILPKILMFLTQHPRIKVDVLWNKQIITPNLFRLWEIVFWRRQGIKVEHSIDLWTDEDGVFHAKYSLYSWESKISFAERMVRNYTRSVVLNFRNTAKLWSWKLNRLIDQIGKIPGLFSPQFVFEGFGIESANEKKPTGYVFAIAFVSAPIDQGGSSTPTVDLGSSSNRLVFSTTQGANGSDSVTAIVWNTTEILTKQGAVQTGSNRFQSIFSFYPVATGSAGAVITGTLDINSWVVYSGVNQTGQPHNYTSASSNASGNSSTFTVSITTAASTDWLFGGVVNGFANNVAGSNTTFRTGGTNSANIAIDSNGASSPTALNASASGGPGIYSIHGVSFSEVSASGPTNLKSLDTNVKANIKSYNTNVLANIKSINTNA